MGLGSPYGKFMKAYTQEPEFSARGEAGIKMFEPNSDAKIAKYNEILGKSTASSQAGQAEAVPRQVRTEGSAQQSAGGKGGGGAGGGGAKQPAPARKSAKAARPLLYEGQQTNGLLG